MTDSQPDFGKRTDFYTFAPESLAEALPAFEIVREVGKGSMGIVYEAHRKADGERVALKVLPPSLTLTERALARFLREGELMQRVQHPSIVAVFDVGRRGRLHYFEMEFVEGRSLGERLEVGPLPIRDLARIGVEVATALQFAHDNGIVHRDVKPANLIERHDGRIAVTDFGLARETGTGSMTESGAIVGTPMFMAPEQIMGERGAIDSRTDVYGLGATLYALATGEPPYAGPTAQSVLKQVLDHRPRRPSRLRADLPKPLEAIIWKAMDPEPALRYGSAADMAEDLQLYLESGRSRARLPGPLARATRAAGQRPVMTTLSAVIVALAIGSYLLHLDGATRKLEAELAHAERTLAMAESSRDELGRKTSDEDRTSLFKTAVAQASRAIAMDSRYARAWFVRAKAHLGLREYREALDDLDRAEELDKPSATLLLFRIDALSHLGDQDALLTDLYRLLDIDPSRHSRWVVADQLLELAWCVDDHTRTSMAASIDRIIAPLPADDGGTVSIAARLLELRGDVNGALQELRRARLEYQGDLRVHTAAVDVFRRQGLVVEEQEAAAMARAIDPTFEPQNEAEPAQPRDVDVSEIQSFLDDMSTLVRTTHKE